MFNWKKKTAIYIGRFQPFHTGHIKLFENALKKLTSSHFSNG